jgi:hypothetical protein
MSLIMTFLPLHFDIEQIAGMQNLKEQDGFPDKINVEMLRVRVK